MLLSSRRGITSTLLGLVVAVTLGCQDRQMTMTEANKTFVATMLGSKKRLEDFPDRVDPNLVMHEPASLPFGGTYRGLAAFQRFYPEVRRFYDFERFALLGVYADGDTVFATIRVGIAGSPEFMYIAEQFIFSGTKLTEVRVHICDPDSARGPSGAARGEREAARNRST
jgi:hypothetical protein